MGRLKMSELCSPVSRGGLGLVSTEKKASSLFVRQACRMLAAEGPGYRHISYWLHSTLPEFSLHDGPRALTEPPWLHRYMRDQLRIAVESTSVRGLMGATARQLYVMPTTDLPVTRLERRNPGGSIEELVWPRLITPTLGVQARHIMFCLVNGLLRNREAMYRQWGRGDPSCDNDPDPTGLCAGVDCTPRHLFMECGRVAQAWEWVQSYIFSHLLHRDRLMRRTSSH